VEKPPTGEQKLLVEELQEEKPQVERPSEEELPVEYLPEGGSSG
jgi:hypothetical protein